MNTLTPEAIVAGRLVCAGDIVRIHGHPRARVIARNSAGRLDELRGWRVLGFEGDTIHVWGARLPKRAPAVRAFPTSLVRA